MKSLKVILKKYPKPHIHYWDNGSWAIYTSEKALERRENHEEDEDEYVRSITLMEGDDSGEGYTPRLVEMLAKQLGITTGSI